MTSSTIDEPDNPIDNPVEASAPVTHAELRAEIERLTRKLEQKNSHGAHSALEHPKRPSGGKIAMLLLLVAAVFLVAFFVGYIPHHRRDLQVLAESNVQNDALPDVTVVAAKKASTMGDLVLPGNIQAVTEAPILARAEGYVQRRYVDIGDRVTAGQLLA